jgi:hypothetical protein
VKRDLSLIREILLDCEKSEDRWFTIGILEDRQQWEELNTDYEELHLAHFDLMVDASLIRKHNAVHPGLGGPEIAEVMFEITWAGFDYLDAVRDDGIWEKTKSAVAETGGSASLELVKSLATGFLKKKIAQHTGIDI